jgi:hypothetical protein
MAGLRVIAAHASRIRWNQRWGRRPSDCRGGEVGWAIDVLSRRSQGLDAATSSGIRTTQLGRASSWKPNPLEAALGPTEARAEGRLQLPHRGMGLHWQCEPVYADPLQQGVTRRGAARLGSAHANRPD